MLLVLHHTDALHTRWGITSHPVSCLMVDSLAEQQVHDRLHDTRACAANAPLAVCEAALAPPSPLYCRRQIPLVSGQLSTQVSLMGDITTRKLCERVGKAVRLKWND